MIKIENKQELIDKIQKNLEFELKRNYSKALSQGYNVALNTILEFAQKKDNSKFDIVEYCKKELNRGQEVQDELDEFYSNKK